MEFSLRYFLTFVIGWGLLLVGNAYAQQQAHLTGVYQRANSQNRPIDYGQRHRRIPRIARYSQELPPQSVLNSNEFALQPSNFPAETVVADPGRVITQGNGSAKADELASRLYQGQSQAFGFTPGGDYPYVTGDIFGVCREGLCDEWYGHCACLELTNSRSNCECTNARRAHWGLSDSVHGDCGSCNSCNNCTDGYGGYSNGPVYQDKVERFEHHPIEMAPRSASLNQRRSVSEYFHPNRR